MVKLRGTAPSYEPHKDPRKLGAKCGECPLKKRLPVIPKPVKRTTKLVVLGEAPGPTEEKLGEFFVGESGHRLDSCLSHFKVPPNAVHVTNALLCRPTENLSQKEFKQAVECCKPRLRRELRPVRNRVIWGLGKRALQAVTGKGSISAWVGAPLDGIGIFEGFTILPSFHPAFCMRKPGYWPTFYTYASRAWDLAQGKLKPWKWPQKFYIEPGKEMQTALQKLLQAPFVAVDIETTGKDPLRSHITEIGIADLESAVCVPFDEARCGHELAMVAKILAKPQLPKTMQNGQFDTLCLERHDFEINNFDFDTIPAHHTLHPEVEHNLGFMATEYFHAERWKNYRKDPYYNPKDAAMTALLRAAMEPEIRESHRNTHIFKEYMALQHVAMVMRRHGCRTVTENKTRHAKNLQPRIQAARNELRAIATAKRCRFKENNKPVPLNPNSNRHLKKLFFTALKAPVIDCSEITDEPSLTEATVSKYVCSTNPILQAAARALLRYRRWSKLYGTYIAKLPLRVHPTFKTAGTVTGRFASEDPNVQNIPQPKTKKLKRPVKEADGTIRLTQVVYPGLRDLFGPEPGNWIVSADYSQLELRIIAGLSKDPIYCGVYDAGGDVHETMARRLFQIPDAAEVNKRQRTRTKNFNYNRWYGGSPRTIWELLVLEDDEITLDMIKYMFEKTERDHGAIVRWHDKLLAAAKENLYVEAPLSGRREHFYEPRDVKPTVVYNFPVQATAADIMNAAIRKLYAMIDWPRETIVFQVHDEIVCQGPDPDALKAKMVEAMECTVELSGKPVHFPIEVKMSNKNWGEAS